MSDHMTTGIHSPRCGASRSITMRRRRALAAARLFILLSSVAILASCASPVAATGVGPRPEQRTRALETVATFKHLGFQVITARIALDIDTALAWRQLDTLLSQPTGDIFWMYPAVGFYLNTKDKLVPDRQKRFREAWKSYTPYRGDTENHFLMYYGSILLMAQEWPGLDGSEWFNGKSSDENYRESRMYLEAWIDESSKHGITEWDSPRYLYYYVTPLIILRDFLTDASLRTRCEMMLELLLADYAVEYLDGSYCGAHSRDSDGAVIDPRKAEATSYAQFYFEDSLGFVLPDLAYAALSDFECPEVIRGIAHARGEPYVHEESRRSRAIMRYASETWRTGHKQSYMTADYCLGSVEGGLLQPIQQHTWDVTFAARRPNNTLYALHPTWSARELGMFFPEVPELMVEGVARAKASYTSPNKWLGASPREMVAQDENTLVALYPIGDDDSVRHVDLFVPASADAVEHDPSGWRFVRFGDAYVGAMVVGDSIASIDEPIARRVRAHAAEHGSGLLAIVVVCGRAADGSFDAFRNSVARNRWSPQLNLHDLGGELNLVDGNLRPHTLRWYDRRQSASTADAWPRASSPETYPSPLFDGPFIRSAAGSGVIELRVGEHRRTLDFVKGEVTEQIEVGRLI